MECTCDTTSIRESLTSDQDPSQGMARPIQVLLVEDDPDAAELVRMTLEDCVDPFRVEWCRGLIEALRRLLEPGIDVILLDLGLPELRGHRSYCAIETAIDHHNTDALLLDLGLTEPRDRVFRPIEDASQRISEEAVEELDGAGLTGGRGCRELGAPPHRIPVIILTADDQTETRQVTMEYGASAYFLKGQSFPGELSQALRAAVQRGRPKLVAPSR